MPRFRQRLDFGLSRKLKLLVATAYIRPKSIDWLESFLQQLEALEQFGNINQLDGLLFTGTPRRGHVPVLLDISPLEYSKVVNDRMWSE